MAIKTKHYFAPTKKRECRVYSNGNGNVGHKPQPGPEIWPGGKTLCDIDEYILAIKPLSKRGNVGFISHFSITVSGRRRVSGIIYNLPRGREPAQGRNLGLGNWVKIGRQNIICRVITFNICWVISCPLLKALTRALAATRDLLTDVAIFRGTSPKGLSWSMFSATQER